MRLFRLTLLASCALAAAPAFAQTAPAPAQAPAPAPADTVSTVTVTGQRAAVVTSIDRQTYNVARDLNAATGSIVDVMRNVPSVSVDVEGNVSLRGAGVQILVDGKRSAMLDGPDRAQFLQQIPASTIESLEVVTNPSAEFSPDGTGGVINIVTKKTKAAGKTGSIQASAGRYGRQGLTALGTYSQGKLNLSGTIGARTGKQPVSGTNDYTRIDTILGLRTDTTSANAGETEQTSLYATATADYDLTKTDRLTFGLQLAVPQTAQTNLYHELRVDGGGVVERDYTIALDGSLDGLQGQLSAGWRHMFAEPGREFNITARGSEVSSTSRNRLVYTYTTPVDVNDVRRLTENDGAQRNLVANYIHPLPGNAVLKMGYEYARNEIGQDFRAADIDDVTGLPVNQVNYTNHFVLVDRNHQAYATYQKPFGKLTVLGGLRLEAAATEYDQRTSAVTGEVDYNEVHPTLHLQYAVAEGQALILSYSHRVQRPNQTQRNPFLQITNEFTAYSGNPALRPQETHSWEAGWRWQEGPKSAGAAVYYRQNYNTIGQVNSFLTPKIVLNTFENQGTSTSTGVALNAGGKAGPTITWRANADLAQVELQRSTLGGAGKRSAEVYTVNGTIEYRPTDKDLLQIQGAYAGKQITNQGYRLPSGALNMGYQRKFSPTLIGVVIVSDLFESTRAVVVNDTATISGTSWTRPAGRTVMVGVSRTFGGRPAREGQFEYEAPAL